MELIISPDPVLLSFDFLLLRFLLDTDFGTVAPSCSTSVRKLILSLSLYYTFIFLDSLIDLQIPLN